jgi:hypothetical protein
MSSRKSAQQRIRESVRRILREGMGDTLKAKLFGTTENPTALRTTVHDTWSRSEEGEFKFVFTPSADKSKLNFVVTAEKGADARMVSDIESAVETAIKGLVPADWADVETSWPYTYPGSVEYKKDEEMELKESWARLAGLKRVL